MFKMLRILSLTVVSENKMIHDKKSSVQRSKSILNKNVFCVYCKRSGYNIQQCIKLANKDTASSKNLNHATH